MTGWIDIACLSGLAFIAGFIDAIAGGGGLIQVPALFIFLPTIPVATVFGTNKLAAIAGTATAAVQYPRHVDVHWRVTLPSALAALVSSYCGAKLVTTVSSDALKPLVFVLLVVVAVYTSFARNLGMVHAPRFGPWRQVVFAIVAGGAIGLYDGFFGPGTGTFLMFVFVGVFGFSFLSATASSKIVNAATNLAALVCFAWTGNILYRIALPMAACNILGALVGTRLTVLKGNKFVRVVYLAVVVGMLARLGWGVLVR